MIAVMRLPALWFLVVVLAGCSCSSKLDLLRVVTSGRDGWQQPERVIEALAIAPGSRVAEIGAGAGYWLPALSRAVGPTGRVYAVEVEPEKVAALERFVAERSLANVEVIFGAYEDPNLPDGQVDLALTSLTYHHIEHPTNYFSALRVDLADGGRVAHLDDRDDLPVPIRWFPTRGHTQSVAVMDAEMAAAGYQQVETFDFLLVQAFRIYEPVAQRKAVRGALQFPGASDERT